MTRGRKPANSNHEMMEAVYHLVDFVQGVSLHEIASGDISESLAESEWQKLSRGYSPEEFTSVLKGVLDYLRTHFREVEGERQLKKEQQILAITLAAIAKIEAYGALSIAEEFQKVMDLKEYKALKDFAFEKKREAVQGKRELLDSLEVVKNDEHYELFSIQKEKGGHYFSDLLPELLREGIDITLLEDTDSHLSPVLSFSEMHDGDLQTFSKNVIDRLKEPMNRFLKVSFSGKKAEVALFLRKSLMALMLSSSKKNSLLNVPVKACSYYFKDFLYFLRQALTHAHFGELVEDKDKIGADEKSLIASAHALCFELHVRMISDHSRFSIIKDLVKRGALRQKGDGRQANSEDLVDKLIWEYKHFSSELDHYVHGPLIKVWDFLQEEASEALFDPWGMGNFPSLLDEANLKNKSSQLMRLPCPIMQSHINRAVMAPEFLGFLRHDPYHTHLAIDLQDMKNGFESARSSALFDLSENPEFKGQLNLARLSMGSEFYAQEGKAISLNKAKAFIDAFCMIFKKGECQVPLTLESKLGEEQLKDLFSLIHVDFFGLKETFSLDERKAFIDISYSLISLKALSISSAGSFSFTCKDGIDKSGLMEGLFMFIQHKLNGKGEEDLYELLHRLVFEVPMIVRERALLKKYFDRMTYAMKIVDTMFVKAKPAIEKWLS